MTDKRPAVSARVCAGCGKPSGCDSHQFGKYWHLHCLLRERTRRARTKSQ